MSLGDDFLPNLDASKTKKAVIEAFDRYRKCKYLTFDEREANVTAGLSDTPKGYTGTTSDQTGDIAAYNIDKQNERKRYCLRVERAVSRLPRMEKFLIEKRYMSEESAYINDQHVYNFEFQPPISWTLYKKYRWEAFYKLALHLGIAVKVESNAGGGENDSSNWK